MGLRDWFNKKIAALHEMRRRAEWGRLHRQGLFPRGRTATTEDQSPPTQEGAATFRGELTAKLIRKG